MQSLTVNSHNEEHTQSLGEALARCLEPGLTVALDGQLGAGKTRLTRAICDGLCVTDELVNSPTFVLMQAYTSGRLPVYHFDAYRLGDVDEFLAIGAEEFLNDTNAVCLVEWASLVDPVLPTDRLSIELTQQSDIARQLHLTARGEVSERVLQRFAAESDL
ncbi:MAG: tRNA (adenosine(37)-N6)-threonylcarbamoyltransferase complex ATPase subunit type 1 TsaE [Fuerstiella sp.]